MGIPRNSPCSCDSGKKYKHCCFQKNYIKVPANIKDVVLTVIGQEKITQETTALDSMPTHNKNGIMPNITKDQMMDLCLDEIYKILLDEKVDTLVDFVNDVVYDLDIVPIFTFREIASKMENDNRFAIYKMNFCSLTGTDPLKLMMDKLL